MKVESSGIIKRGLCSICLAHNIVVVINIDENNKTEVCKPCLDKQIENNIWYIPGAIQLINYILKNYNS